MVLIANFEKEPLKVPESHFVGMTKTQFPC